MNSDLSIIVLTKNEADNISRSLSSVGWADEVILLDCSTDDTIAIAKKICSANRLRIVNTPHVNDFASLRNLGLELARNEWVFFLDADEEIPPELSQEIREAITNKHKSGYLVKRKDYFLGKTLRYGETAGVKLLKLGRKSAGNWRRRVHEVWDIKGEIGELEASLLHFPHPTVSEFLS
ncbi:MAG: glycosyltransferase family 2 protein, partial [Patescibacteria group bacterium]